MKIRTRWLVITGLLVFVYTLIMHAPLAILYGRLKPDGAVELVGLQGSLSSGSAAVVVRGRTAVSDLVWRFKPLQLLLGRAAFHVSSTDGLLLDGQAALLASGGLRLGDFRASGSIKSLLAAAQIFAPVDGALGVELERLVLRDGFPTDAQGRVTLDGLGWTLGREPLALGDFEARIAPEAGKNLLAQVQSLRGPLEVSGEVHLQADRSYDVHLQLRAKADAPPPVVNLLRGLGAPDNQGYYHLRRRGQLVPAAAAKEISR